MIGVLGGDELQLVLFSGRWVPPKAADVDGARDDAGAMMAADCSLGHCDDLSARPVPRALCSRAGLGRDAVGGLGPGLGPAHRLKQEAGFSA